MTNNLDKFEQLIKESFNDYEAPYNPNHWQDLRKELTSGAGGDSFHYFSSIATGLVLTFAIIASIFLFMPGDSGSRDSHANIEATDTIDQGQLISSNTPEELQNSAVATTDSSGENTKTLSSSGPDSEKATSSSSKTKRSKNSVSKASTVAVTTATTEGNKTSTLRTGCVGLTVEFTSANKAEDANFLWNFGDGYFSSSSNPVHTYTRPGQFDVSLSVTSKSSGQISSNVVQGSIVIVEAPTADFRPDILDASRIRLVNASSNAAETNWIINNNASPKDKIIDLKVNNDYNIVLVAVNENGCSDSLMKNIEVKYTGIQTVSGGTFIPNHFDDSETTVFKVFDPSGKNVIYESNSKTLPWIYDKRQQLNNPWLLISKSNDGGKLQIYTGRLTSDK